MFNTDTYEEDSMVFETDEPTQALLKIRVTSQDSLFATVDGSMVYSILVTDNLTETTVQDFASSVPSVALSPTGSSLFYVNNDQTG